MNNYGFIKEETQEEHWKLGSGLATLKFGAAALMPGGHGWGKYVPKKEIQRRGTLETQACTVFGSLNCLETLAKFHGFTEFPVDCAERFSGVMAKISPTGAAIHQTCEAIRVWGVVPETTLPFSGDIYDWPQFYSPDPMNEDFLALAKTYLKKFVIGHEWIFNGGIVLPSTKQAKLKEALSRGAVGVAVHAWEEGEKYFKSGGEPNHWLQLVDYKEGEYWVVNDHYEPTQKKLEWNFDFYAAKLYFLSRNTSGATPQELNYLMRLLQNMLSLLKRLGSWIGSTK